VSYVNLSVNREVQLTDLCEIGEYGLTPSELDRYKAGILSEAEQSAAQVNQINHEMVLNDLMEAVSLPLHTSLFL
jgi:hypothetical protein